MQGELIGRRYRIHALLGSGAMGAVYEAEHVPSGARFAVKILRAEVADNPEIRLRFAREVAATRILDHENVVKVVDAGAADDGSLFLAMELVRGVSLADVIRDGQVAPRRALAIARQVLGALVYTHAIGVIHRDLKPDNILLADGGHPDRDEDLVKLLDFGIAKLVGDAEAELASAKLTQAGVAFGTPWYMAPEQALGQAVDARADLYAVGVVLFELLTGLRPFDHPDRIAVLRMQVTQRPPTLAEAAPDRAFTAQVEHVIAEALAKRREDRYGSAAEMLAAVEVALATLDPAPPALAPSILDRFGPSLAEAPTILEPIDLREAVRGLCPLPADPAESCRALFPARTWPRPPAALIVPAALTLAVVLALLAAPSGRIRSAASTPILRSDLARAGESLLAAEHHDAVIALLGSRLGLPLTRGDGHASLVLGHALASVGRLDDALGAYERAIVVAPWLAADDRMIAGVAAGVAVAPQLALDFLAARSAPRARAELVALASAHQDPDIRRRAQEIAARGAFGHDVDGVASALLDLRQGATCTERRAAVPRLAASGDARAIPPLRAAAAERRNRCLRRDATRAVTRLRARA